jgi:galactonate dehydratase
MKIARLQTHQVSLPEDAWMYVSIETEEGLVGWGEMTSGGYASAMAQTMDELAPMLIGKDPRRLSEHIEQLYRWMFPNPYRDRLHVAVLSAIDQALWDLYGQACGLPLYVLLGAFGCQEVPLYANLNRGLRANPQLRSPEALEERGKRAIEEGFAFVKCTPFDEQNPNQIELRGELGLERIRGLLRSVPIEKIAIDFHQRFEHWSLERILPSLLEAGMPYWLEDPVSTEDISAMRSLRQQYPSIRWAGGESVLTAREAFSLIQEKCIDVFMPDVKYAGGVSGMKTMIALAETSRTRLSPHNPSGPVSTAFSAHLTAACRFSLPMEFPFAVTSLRRMSVIPEEPVQSGTYKLSDLAGIGIKPDPQFMKEYARVWKSGTWL